MKPIDIILLALSALLAVAGILLAARAKKKLMLTETPPKKLKRSKLLWTLLSLVGSWVFVVTLLKVIFGGGEKEAFTVELSAERFELFGVSLSSTVILTWIVMAVLILFGIFVRVFVVPRLTDKPKGIQNLLEAAVEGISKYTDSKVEGLGMNLGAYIFSLALLMVGCAAVELLGVRAPTADITMTFAMALVTFVLINYYGIRRKGIGGRVKSLASPTPLVFPIRVICDIAIPVSMACRLFGNMLGGMIVMDLLYMAMGSGAVAIPSVVGLYFNVFHPLIQTFIFITLTLTFINEAVE